MANKIQKVYQSQTYQYFKKNTPRYKKKNITHAEFLLLRDQRKQVNHKLIFLRQNLVRAANRVKKRYHIDIDLDYLYDIGEQQNWKCALSGVDLEFRRGGGIWLNQYCNPHSCTIDRIDSNQGYVKGNVQLVTWKSNTAKNGMDHNEFLDLCYSIYYYQRSKNQ